MTNEQYLIASYFLVAGLCAVLAALTYGFLRRPFEVTAEFVSGGRLRAMLKKIFPVGLLLPALLAFTSIAYETCSVDTYEGVIRNRAYLVQRNQQQISRALLFLVIAVLFWDLVIVFVLKYARSRRNGRDFL